MLEIALDTEWEKQIPFLATACYYSEKHKKYRAKLLKIEEPKDYQWLKNVCESDKYVKIFHNAPEMLLVLQNIGIKTNGVFRCTMIASSLVNELHDPVGLKALGVNYLDYDISNSTKLTRLKTKYKNKAKKEKREFKWSDLPREQLEAYALDDAIITMRLWREKFKNDKLFLIHKDLYEFEMILCKAILWMMTNKVYIDRDFVGKMHGLYFAKRLEYLGLIAQYLQSIGYEDFEQFNPHPSSPHTRKVLAYLKIDTGTTEKGLVKTDTKSLQEYSEHEFIKLLSKYKHFDKHDGTYYAPLYNKYTTKENWNAVFMVYQSAARTGRFRMELFQTFPKPKEAKSSGQIHEVRKCVIPRKNRQLVCIDMEQEEARIFAARASCKKMIEAFKKNQDVYLNGAYWAFGQKNVESNDKLKIIYRDIMKALTLGFIYGLGSEKTIYQLTTELKAKVDKEIWQKLDIDEFKANEIIKTYHNTYPEIKEYTAKKSREVYDTGGISVYVDSPKMKLVRFYNIPHDKAYTSVNTEVQGLAGYVLKWAIYRTVKWIFKQRMEKYVKFIQNVHDELIFEIPIYEDKKEEKQIILSLKNECEDLISFSVPLTASVKTSSISWGEVKTYAF